MAKITIKSAVNSITRDKKDGSGTYTKHTQEATFETDSMRIAMEVEVKDPRYGYAEGVYAYDVENQLVVGRFGLELPRFPKLVPLNKTATKAA